jgi:hypothetical protein
MHPQKKKLHENQHLGCRPIDIAREGRAGSPPRPIHRHCAGLNSAAYLTDCGKNALSRSKDAVSLCFIGQNGQADGDVGMRSGRPAPVGLNVGQRLGLGNSSQRRSAGVSKPGPSTHMDLDRSSLTSLALTDRLNARCRRLTLS